MLSKLVQQREMDLQLKRKNKMKELPISPPVGDITPTIPISTNSQKFLTYANPNPASAFNIAPYNNVFLLPNLSAVVVKTNVIKRSPINMHVNKIPDCTGDKPILSKNRYNITAIIPSIKNNIIKKII